MVLKRACLYFFLLSLVSCIYEPDEDDNFGIETMSGDLKGNSIALNPDVCFSYYVLQNLSVNLTTGYCFDFKGDLEIDAPFSGYSWIQKSDWSGLRIGLSTSYKF